VAGPGTQLTGIQTTDRGAAQCRPYASLFEGAASLGPEAESAQVAGEGWVATCATVPSKGIRIQRIG
jgi:hypothetical protein